MKDIVKCAGTDCDKRDSCERFTHPARDKHQAYMIMRVSIPDPNKACRFFIENKLDEQS